MYVIIIIITQTRIFYFTSEMVFVVCFVFDNPGVHLIADFVETFIVVG